MFTYIVKNQKLERKWIRCTAIAGKGSLIQNSVFGCMSWDAKHCNKFLLVTTNLSS